jgi:hypothetical protein
VPVEGFTLADAVAELSDGELAEVETVVVLDGALERSELEHAAMSGTRTDARAVRRLMRNMASSRCGAEVRGLRTPGGKARRWPRHHAGWVRHQLIASESVDVRREVASWV